MTRIDSPARKNRRPLFNQTEVGVLVMFGMFVGTILASMIGSL